MAELLLVLLLLQPQVAAAGTAEIPAAPVEAIDLHAAMLQARPDLAAADTLVLLVEANREAYFKVSERDDILASGQLLKGSNSLQFTRPGLFARSQSLFFLLDLLENGTHWQKKIGIAVTVSTEAEMEREGRAELSGSFALGMYHGGRLIGYRKKSMVDLLKLKTGPVSPVEDPGLRGSAIRDRPASQSISILGLGMALAKLLAGKKAEKRAQAHAAESQKKRLALTILRAKKEIPIVIELRIE
jgi:hypothetical protein